MTYQIEITDYAYFDLDDIYAYLSNISNARPHNTITQILDVIDTLNELPNRGKIEPHLESLNLSHRFILSGHYKIIYRIIIDTVYITHVFDSRQNPSKMRRV